MKFINEIFIARSPEIVFRYVSDIKNIPVWNYAVVKTEMISTEFVGAGTVYRQQRKFLGRILEDTFIISSYQVNSLLTLRSIEAEYPFLVSYSFKPSRQGTIVINAFELHGRLGDSLLGILFKGSVKRAVGKNLEVLKGLIEKG
ncbi:MAG: SRPBCC family protein [Chitinophaga sp.]|uniref:SRPBCC family protein n=1 Tax=Chitinophaga sp. TaxID=1869181 RepID=UPI001B0A3978|nr:SRPBCC family protein [Chitinophaga sp.]MBO9729368.1 SRPBCC family protein [Chitinophaga sp.]